MALRDGRIPRTVFLGSKSMGLRCLEAIYASVPDSLVGVQTVEDSEDTRSVQAGFAAFCDKRRIPFTVVRSRRDSEARLRAMEFELALVRGWYWIISADVLERARLGFLGVHNSLLPRYQGAAPVVWAMLNREPGIGASMYALTDRVDCGDIYAQTSVDVSAADYIADVLTRLETKCAEMVSDVFPRLLAETIQPTPQDLSLATYGCRRTPDHGRIRWTWSAESVYDFIRAQSKPYPGAFTHYDGRRVAVWRARPFEPTWCGTPGQIARVSPAGVHVICGDHRAIILERVQVQNEPEADAQEVMRMTGPMLLE